MLVHYIRKTSTACQHTVAKFGTVPVIGELAYCGIVIEAQFRYLQSRVDVQLEENDTINQQRCQRYGGHYFQHNILEQGTTLCYE